MTPRKILILGATSPIAEATARRYAEQRASLFLAAPNANRLAAIAADLRARGAKRVDIGVLDAQNFDHHPALLAQADEALGGLDLALIAHGTTPDQEACETSFERARSALETDCLSTLSLLTHLANRLEPRGRGTLAVLSSVAGERGRRSDYVYGTAMGAVTVFLQGLRNRLAKSGVRVLTVKLGPIDTAMIAARHKGPLWASPDQVAAGILRAVEKERKVLYCPGVWRLIMLLIRILPERGVERLSL